MGAQPRRGQPASSAHSDSARYRTGSPQPGEIAIRGPRVLTAGGQAGGEVVAAVDETIRYTPRKAGYHGGASPAEVVIPAITLLPSASLLPPGWYAYDAAGHAPSWWDAPASTAQTATAQAADGSSARCARSGIAALAVASAKPPCPTKPTRSSMSGECQRRSWHLVRPRCIVGRFTRRSARGSSHQPGWRCQRQFVRRAPDDASVAALIDGLAQAGGRLTITEAASTAGESPVRMSGYLAHVTRLLNVDGYPVLGTTDGAGRWS